MESKMKVLLGIFVIIASTVLMIFLFILDAIYTYNYLSGDVSNLWRVFVEDTVFSLVSGSLLIAACFVSFPLLIGVLLVYRGWKGEFK